MKKFLYKINKWGKQDVPYWVSITFDFILIPILVTFIFIEPDFILTDKMMIEKYEEIEQKAELKRQKVLLVEMHDNAIGSKVIIDGKEYTIINYNFWRESYTTSNGLLIHNKDLQIFIKK